MRPSKFFEFVQASLKQKRTVMVQSAPGIGKSSIIDQAVAALRRTMSVKYITTFPYMEDPTVPAGFPFPSEDKRSATFLPFGATYDALYAKESLIVWHIEDLGWADFSMQKAYANMINRRMFNNTRFPDKLVYIISTNRATDMAGVSGFLEPFKSRCDSIVELDLRVDDWIEWALGNGMPTELIVHIRNHPTRLLDFKPTKDLTQSACPRNWEHVGNWTNDGYKPDLTKLDGLNPPEIAKIEEHNSNVREIWTGSVGKGDAAEYYTTFELMGKVPDIDSILMDPDHHPVPDNRDASIMYAVTTALAAKSANKAVFDTALKFAVRMPKQFEVLFVKDAHRRSNGAIVNTRSFTKWAINPENRDIVCSL